MLACSSQYNLFYGPIIGPCMFVWNVLFASISPLCAKRIHIGLCTFPQSPFQIKISLNIDCRGDNLWFKHGLNTLRLKLFFNLIPYDQARLKFIIFLQIAGKNIEDNVSRKYPLAALTAHGQKELEAMPHNEHC